jgi:1-aminocyclopropane-1-carboxylate deaminase/D-cysteine desulfhydrase-like pyridoxal-dependent ACC family enzyme
MIVRGDADLTPVQRFDGRCAFKRDDLFQPYSDVPLSGGKVRQARALLHANADRIRASYDATVLTATGVHSPQGLIIARVARELDFRCVLFLGATSAGSAITRHAMIRRALELGASLDCSAGTAYEAVLARSIERWRARQEIPRGYVVRFGINLEDDPDAILGSTAAQVANLPDDVERIVVATGAGITAAGVILGAAEHRPRARVVCVQIAGYDRQETIGRIVGDLPYEWHSIDGVPYSRLVRERPAPGLELDPIYEAKAFRWLRERGDDVDPRVTFWIVGDSRAVRA